MLPPCDHTGAEAFPHSRLSLQETLRKQTLHTASLLVRIDLYEANNFSMDDATTISIILHILVTNTKSLCGTPCFEGRPSDVFTAV